MKTKLKFANLMEETSILLVLAEASYPSASFCKYVSDFMNGFNGTFQDGIDACRADRPNESWSQLSLEIEAFVETGEIPLRNKLLGQVPKGLLEIALIPDLGPHGAKIIFETLDITSLGELEYACKEN